LCRKFDRRQINCTARFITLRHPKIYIMKLAHFIIVDDDAINNRLCQLCIARHFGDAPTQSFQDPQIALDAIAASYGQAETPTVLLLDVYMPNLTGWDFLDRFDEFPTSIKNQFKILTLSSSTDDALISRARQHPLVSGYLSKPLTETSLEEVFRELPDSFGVRCFR